MPILKELLSGLLAIVIFVGLSYLPIPFIRQIYIYGIATVLGITLYNCVKIILR